MMKSEGNETVQHIICFPLESLLGALGRSTVNFFSMDGEELDYEVLASVFWDVLLIQARNLDLEISFLAPFSWHSSLSLSP